MLASRFERAAHLEGDLVGHPFIVSGLVPPQGPPQGEADDQLALRRSNLCLLADSFADAGFLPIIDDVVVSVSVLTGYQHRLRNRPLLFVHLIPSLEVVQARDESRDKHVFDLWRHLDAEVRTRMPRVGLWLDSSHPGVEETVDAVVTRLGEAILHT